MLDTKAIAGPDYLSDTAEYRPSRQLGILILGSIALMRSQAQHGASNTVSPAHRASSMRREWTSRVIDERGFFKTTDPVGLMRASSGGSRLEARPRPVRKDMASIDRRSACDLAGALREARGSVIGQLSPFRSLR